MAETRPGGYYINAQGVAVNADGKPIVDAQPEAVQPVATPDAQPEAVDAEPATAPRKRAKG